MKSAAELVLERDPLPVGDERFYAVIAGLIASASRRAPRAGICRYGPCVKTTRAGRRFCRIHDLGGDE